MAQVARSVDAPLSLIPVLPGLFDGLDGLGCMPDVTARLLAAAGIGPRSRVIDLGCGKGAVAVALARRTGCRVLGLDACADFIEAARQLAERRDVARLCQFRVGDVHRPPRVRGGFEAGLMIGVRPLEEAAAILRPLVKSGGVYVIDDVIRVRGRRMPPGVHALDRAEARHLLTATGDELVAEYVPTPARVAAMNRTLHRRIAANVKKIIVENPGLRPALDGYLRRQGAANRQLTGPIRPAIWVIRRRR